MKLEVLRNETFTDVKDLPQRKSDRSTGYDVVAVSDPEIVGVKYNEELYESIDYIQYRTNLYVAVKPDHIPHFGFGYELIDYDVLAFPRSSVSKYNLTLANSIGLIDADYRGEVLLRFKYHWQPIDFQSVVKSNQNDLFVNQVGMMFAGKPNLDKIYKKGDAICQLKITRVENVQFEIVSKLDDTERGSGGFGSTDVKKGEKASTAAKQMSTVEELYNKMGGVITPSKKYTQLISERDSQQFNN